MAVDEWIKRSREWVDYEKLRRLFGVFAEEEL